NEVFKPSVGSFDSASGLWNGLTLGKGQSVTMTLTGTVPSSATGNLVNTITVSPPAGVTDPNLGNNTGSDTDTLTPQADLGITNNDFTNFAQPGKSTTYTIVVTNHGPSDVIGAQVTDIFSAMITSATWTSTALDGASGNTASGSGNINDTVNLPAGSSIIYTV